jgi:hypothetical protein
MRASWRQPSFECAATCLATTSGLVSGLAADLVPTTSGLASGLAAAWPLWPLLLPAPALGCAAAAACAACEKRPPSCLDGSNHGDSRHDVSLLALSLARRYEPGTTGVRPGWQSVMSYSLSSASIASVCSTTTEVPSAATVQRWPIKQPPSCRPPPRCCCALPYLLRRKRRRSSQSYPAATNMLMDIFHVFVLPLGLTQ